MSVRAYKVKKILLARNPRFNLWHDDELVSYLEKFCSLNSGLNSDGCGIVYFGREDIENAISTAVVEGANKETIKTLKAILRDCGKDFGVEYSCF